MLDDILEEFMPTETITIVVKRMWKNKKHDVVKQVFEIPVLVIRNTGKAILVTKENGSSWVNGKKGEALWIPSFAMDAVGSKKYNIRYDKIDSKDFDKFVKKYNYEPVVQESIDEGLLERVFSDEELHSKKPFKVVVKKGFRDWRTKSSVLRTYEFDGCVIHSTDKAVCIAMKGSSFHTSSSKGDAFWIPLYVLRRDGNTLLINRPNIDSKDMMNFLRKKEIEPTEEPLNESLMSFTEFLLEREEFEHLNEGRGFELGGKKYSSGFGRYTCNGESISKEEYMRASMMYKNGDVSVQSVQSKPSVTSVEVKRAVVDVKDFLDSFEEGNHNDYLMFYIQDGERGVVKKVFSQIEPHIEMLRKTKVAPEMVNRYDKLLNAYQTKENEVQTILSCVKIGEPQESAIKKISKMTKTLKHYSIEDMKYTTNYFDPMSEKDVLKEIKSFNGQIKLRGPMDYYIEIKNGRVSKTYF